MLLFVPVLLRYVFDLEDFFFQYLTLDTEIWWAERCVLYESTVAKSRTNKSKYLWSYDVFPARHSHQKIRGSSLGHGAAGLQLYLLLDADS